MPTKIILTQLELPERGAVNVNIDCSFEIAVTAEEARRKVKRWLLDEISQMMTAETPTLVIDTDKTVWRVPAILTATHVGHVGVAGEIDVDTKSGEMDGSAEQREKILLGARKLAAQLPPYHPRTIADMPQQYILNEEMLEDVQPTPVIPRKKALDPIAAT